MHGTTNPRERTTEAMYGPESDLTSVNPVERRMENGTEQERAPRTRRVAEVRTGWRTDLEIEKGDAILKRPLVPFKPV